MKTFSTIVTTVVFLCAPLSAQDEQPKQGNSQGDTWTKSLKDRSQRGMLHGAFQKVRGDSGKWNDDPKLQHASSLPSKTSLDDWYDRTERSGRRQLTPDHDNWLLFKTKQLDDNDRVWIERIERNGNQFTVTLNQAIWQGRYQKTFTYYSVFGVNLGKLPAGTYQAKWIIKPLAFRQFEGNGRPRDEKRRDNWSKDEHPVDQIPAELSSTFNITAATD